LQVRRNADRENPLRYRAEIGKKLAVKS